MRFEYGNSLEKEFAAYKKEDGKFFFVYLNNIQSALT
jgi:hypothetical protein